MGGFLRGPSLRASSPASFSSPDLLPVCLPGQSSSSPLPQGHLPQSSLVPPGLLTSPPPAPIFLPLLWERGQAHLNEGASVLWALGSSRCVLCPHFSFGFPVEPELCWDAFWIRKEPQYLSPSSDFLCDFKQEFRLFGAFGLWSRRIQGPRSRPRNAEVRAKAKKTVHFSPEQGSSQAQPVP